MSATDAEPNGHGLLVELKYLNDLKRGDLFVWRTDDAFGARPGSRTLRYVHRIYRLQRRPDLVEVTYGWSPAPRMSWQTATRSRDQIVAVLTVDPAAQTL